MRVLLHGCNGKMGQAMIRVIGETPDMEVVCGVDRAQSGERQAGAAVGSAVPCPVYASLDDVPFAGEATSATSGIDILIDFSHHTALDSILDFGTKRHVPLLICTTGFSDEEKARMEAASKEVPVLHSANMSLGVNLLVSLVSQAARVLSDTFDIEIVEKHHNQKLDAPSGTALMIADAINHALADSLDYIFGRNSKTVKRQKKDLGIHAVRGGAIVGEHNVIFAGQGEVVEVNHIALSRDVFAHGAVMAARFLVGKKPGLYSMKDVIEAGSGR